MQDMNSREELLSQETTEKLAALIRPLPASVRPADEFLIATRLRLLALDRENKLASERAA
jgi:hypothetical protein